MGEAAMASRALVLGGGGPVGIAWESGLLAGLARAGVDLGKADFIMGTSAGSFVGARLALGAETAGLADPILADAAKAAAAPSGGGTRNGPPADLSKLMTLMAEAQSGTRDPQAVRAEIGAFALAANTMDEAAFIATFGRAFASLPDDAWPQHGYACTAVDAETGEFRFWTKDSGVGVTRAVASSCSVPGIYPPVTLDGRRYIDGGMRSSTNADMAKGHDTVVVVAVRLGGADDRSARLAAKLDEEVKALTDAGAKVTLIAPDAASAAAMGANLMDFRRRGDAAKAGLAQGEALAAQLAGAWGA
jgi:NTE family protein